MISHSNPYANMQLRIPDHEWESVRRFTTTFKPDDGSPVDIDRSPFDRYVDLWWCALALGVRAGRRSTPHAWHDFVTGVVFNQDPWRIRHMELLALAEDGPSALDDPGKVIAIANEYAATGMSILLDTMTGLTEPSWGLTNFLRTQAEESLRGQSD